MFSYMNVTYSKLNCECGNTMEFETGYAPKVFYCLNCGKEYILGENCTLERVNYNFKEENKKENKQ